MGLVPVTIVAIGHPVKETLLEGLKSRLTQFIAVPVTKADEPVVSTSGAERTRGRTAGLQDGHDHSQPTVYDADRLLDLLIAATGRETPLSGQSFLGVTGGLLATRAHGPVFGTATLGGRWAIVGVGALAPNDDSRRVIDRVTNIAIHELGHVAGLGHCRDSGCVMAHVTDTAGIDARGNHFCFRCVTVMREPAALDRKYPPG